MAKITKLKLGRVEVGPEDKFLVAAIQDEILRERAKPHKEQNIDKIMELAEIRLALNGQNFNAPIRFCHGKKSRFKLSILLRFLQ